MLVYSIQTTINFSPDDWRPETTFCFYTSSEDVLPTNQRAKLRVIFIFCNVPFDEHSGSLSTEAINVVLDYVSDLREKISNESIWLTMDDKFSRLTFKKNGERSLDVFDFSLNIWRKKDAYIVTLQNSSLPEEALESCPILKFTKKLG